MTTMYNMVTYKFNLMHIEDDIINLSLIGYNRNVCPRKEKNVVMNPVWFL